ncbi:MAG TPA: iron ABC transporter permease [Candidatus Acidoferrales bacterium]|nr:iron ABC transporter permease [Candidatus Acidoferrales bacterium]
MSSGGVFSQSAAEFEKRGPIPSWLVSQGRQYLVPFLGTAFTAWLIVVPLFFLIVSSFRSGTPWHPEAFTLQNYINAYSTSHTYVMFANTAVFAAASTLLSLVLAVLFAFLTERTDMPFRNVAWGLIIVPMAIPGLLFAVSWTFLLSPHIGLFNLWLRSAASFFGIEIAQGPFNIYSLWGMIFLDGLRGVTTIFLIIVGAFRAMDPSLEEASRAAGASNFTTFFRIFLPLLSPALLAAGMYSFMNSMESLEIPLVIGLPARIFVFSSYIYFSAQRFVPPQYGLSAALGASYLLISILLVFWYRRLIGDVRRFATVTGKGYRPRILQLGKWRHAAFALFVVYFAVTIAAPCFVLVWTSLLPVYTTPSWEALSGLTLRNYRAVLSLRQIQEAIGNTVIVALATAAVTMILSLIVGWTVVRGRIAKWRGFLDAITFLPQSLPGVIIGIAFIFLYMQPPLNHLGLYGSLWILVMALAVSYVAFGTRTMMGALTQIHQELEEAGEVCGSSWSSIMRRITLPLLMPAFISGAIWVASHALRNLSIPLILSTRGNPVLSVIIWHTWEDGYPGRTAALGVMLIGALAILAIAGRVMVHRLSRHQES